MGIDEDTYIEALHKVNIRSRREIDASADLLANVINMYVRTSYAAYMNALSLSERTRVISSLSKIYFCDYYIDIDADMFYELDAQENIHTIVGTQGIASAMLQRLQDFFIITEYEKTDHSLIDLASLKERLKEQQSVSSEFFSEREKWCRASFIVARRDENGLVTHMLFWPYSISRKKKNGSSKISTS